MRLDNRGRDAPVESQDVMSQRFFVVPHTHWDREWYLPFEHFRLALGHVVDDVLDVLERDDAFTSFTLDGQAVVLEDYLDVRPENEGRLRELLATGRIEVGPSYVLPDEFLIGGEPLVRNLLIGREICRRFGVEPTPVGYLPDSFGHPLQIPQILAGFGIDNVLFSRGLGDEIDDVGVVFRWRAPDGSQVLAFQLLDHYGNFAAVAGADDAQGRIHGLLDRFGEALTRAHLSDVLLCNGSDHLPIQPELPQLCRELERRLPGKRFAISRYSDYVEAVGKPEVSALEGELLGSRIQNVLRGVNSARLYLKQANERAEQTLLAVETLASLRTLHDGTPFPTADFRLAWRDLLRCHPHDSICGCSCDEVHRDMLVRYQSLERTLSLLAGRTLEGLAVADPPAGAIVVVNPLPHRCSNVIELPGREPLLAELDGFAAATFTTDVALRRRQRLHAGDAIENERFAVRAMPDGTLTVLDKRAGRSHPGLHALEDESDMGDPYNFCPVAGAPRRRFRQSSARILTEGPLLWELEVTLEGRLPASLGPGMGPTHETVPFRAVTLVRLVRGSDRIEFRTTIVNEARDHRLRVVFPVGEATGPVRAEAQFAVARRPLDPPQPRTSWVEPPDRTQHMVGAVALGPLALLSKGLPEYEARAAGGGAELCLTLLRCVGLISRPSGVLATRPNAAGPQVETPDGQCLGRHELEYALLFDADALDDVALLRASQGYRHEVVVAPMQAEFDPPLEVAGDVVFSCLKGAEDGDGLILRCFNPGDSPVTGRVTARAPVAIVRTRLDETGEEPVAADGAITVGAGEIATLRIRREGAG